MACLRVVSFLSVLEALNLAFSLSSLMKRYTKPDSSPKTRPQPPQLILCSKRGCSQGLFPRKLEGSVNYVGQGISIVGESGVM